MKTPSRRPARLALLRAILIVLTLGPAPWTVWAEETPPAAEATDPEPPAPVAIPLAEMAERAEDATRILRAASKVMERQGQVTDIAETTAKRLDAFPERVEEALLAADGAASPQQLVELDFSWTLQRQDIRAWIKSLTERLKTLDEQIATLEDLEETWQLTLQEGRTESVPAAVFERGQDILRDTRDGRRQLKDRRSDVLALQARLGKADDQTTQVLERIAEARTEIRARLLLRGQPPVWKALGTAGNLDSIVASVVTAVRRERDQLVAYLVDDSERVLGSLAVQVGLFLASLYAVRALRRRVRRQQRDESTDRVIRPYESIFVHPLSAAFLVALLPTPWLHPYAPPVLNEIHGLVILIPLLFLLPALMGNEFRKTLLIFTAFYLLDRVRFLVDAVPLADRLMLLAEAVVAFVLIAWFARPPADERGETATALSSARTIIARVAMGFLAIGFLANVLGYFTLAKVIGEGILNSAYLALLLYAGTSVMTLVVAAVVHGKTARRSHVIRNNAALIEQRASRLIAWAAALTWLFSTLDLFTIQDPMVGWAAELLEDPIALGAISFTLGDIVAFVVIVWLARWIARMMRIVLEEEVFPRAHLARGIPAAISTTIQYVVLLIGFVFALGAAGFDLSNVTLLAGAFGVGIGFGLQNVVNNFTSGLVLLFERPISVGDAVQVGDLFGEIRRIGLRSSTLRTWQGAEVIVPNANLISDQVTNWTLSDRNRRIELPVGVEYGTDPEQVIQLLTDVAKAHPDVMDYPEPGALFTGFGDSSLDFELRAWTAQFDRFLRIKSELAVGINNALRDADITIPFPQRDLHVRSVDPEAAGQLSPPGPQRSPGLGEKSKADPATPLAGSGSPPRSFNRN